MPFVNTIARIHKEEIAGTRDAARAHIVLRHAELFHHIEHPNAIGLVCGWYFLGGKRPVVFPVVKPFRIEALHLAPAADVPEAIPFH